MCDDSHAAAWKEPGDRAWSLYWIRWNPGNPAAEAAKVHRPDVCLNAEGAIMGSDLGTHLLTIAGRPIPFHGYTFHMVDKTLYVFYCLYEEIGTIPGASPAIVTVPPATPQFEATGMLQRALAGRRHIGAQSLEIALAGYPTEQSARQAFESRLGELIQIKQSP